MQSTFKMTRITAYLISALAIFNSSAQTTDAPTEVIKIKGHEPHDALGNLSRQLSEQGVDFSAAGGVSALPVMNGMMGDRIKVIIDGAELTAACANQMNPPLSYVSANQVKSTQVIAGLTPVRSGGDNIAGVINLQQMRAQFADTESLSWQRGYVAGEYQSNGDQWLAGIGAHWASDTWSIDYQGAYEQSKSYDDGNGDKVLDTLYESQNHALTMAWRDSQQQLSTKITAQMIPYQGFPNQYMDMTDNQSLGAHIQYQRELAIGGQLTGYVNWQSVEHEMGFFSPEKPGMMPMVTDATDRSYKLHWHLPTQQIGAYSSQITLGHELFDYQLDDYWPALAGSMMMGPNPYININNGQRQRIAVFADSDTDIADNWVLNAGIRIEHVRTDADEVQPYNDSPMMGMPNVDATAATAFNQADREQTDNLVDATLATKYTIDPQQSLELGIARKNRAPNLYERYSWGRGVMATTMIGWFGDGNGYVGRIDLQPETATTLKATYQRDDANNTWQFSVSPFYSRVDDYIDANVIDTFNRGTQPSTARNILQMTNVDATLKGISAHYTYRWTQVLGADEWQLRSSAKYTHGEQASGRELYQIQPLTIRVELSQQWGHWRQTVRVEHVEQKDRVDQQRLENRTDAYQVVDWQVNYTRANWQLNLGITNLLDEFYRQPLGGVSIAAQKAGQTQGFENVAGAGRSINFGVRYTF